MEDSKRIFYTITAGEFISNVGDRFQKIALPILIYEIFKSPFALGGIVIIEMLPQLIFGFFMGYILDKYNRKFIMIMSILIQLLLCLLIPVAHHYQAEIGIYYSIAFILPVFGLLFQTSFSVVLPTLFKDDELQKANSQFQTVRTISKLISPGIAGVLIVLLSIDMMFIINSLSFIFLLIAILFSDVPKVNTSSQVEKNILKSILTGFQVNFNNDKLKRALLITILINICMLGFNSTIVFYLKDYLEINDSILGVVYSISGLGSLIGSIVSFKFVKRSLSDALRYSMVAIPILVISSAMYPSWITFAICYGLISMMITISSITITTIQQQESDPENIGKILSSAFVIAMTLSPIGGVLTSFISTKFSPNISLYLLGLGTLIGALLIYSNDFFRKKEISR